VTDRRDDQAADGERAAASPARPSAASEAVDAHRAEQRRKTWTGIDAGNIMSMELLSAVLLWAGVGYLVDRWLGTDPWFLAIGAILGNAVGIWLIYLRSGRMTSAGQVPPRRPLVAPSSTPSSGVDA
jgi:F0F1-type ATP synthase assembly protein I